MTIKKNARRLKNKKQAQKKKVYNTFSPWRYYFVATIVALVALALICRLAYIQVIEKDYLSNEADKRSLRIIQSISHRGNISDRNGEELAISVPAYAIWVDPKRVMKTYAFTEKQWQESKEVSHRSGKVTYNKKKFYSSKRWSALAEVLNYDLKKLAKIVSKPHARFVYLKRQVNDPIVKYIKKLKISGIASQLESHRFYPTGEINANILGFTDLDAQGIEGLEKTYNSYLQGVNGKKRVRKDRDGNVIANLQIISKKKEAGNLQLSIDQRIQALAYSEIKRAVKMNDAMSGSLVLLDVNTGEVYAMVNYPSFNPNDRSQYQAYKSRNRAIADTFEPGSSVKPFVIASALIYGKTTVDEIIDTSPGWMHIGGRIVRDGHNMGKLNLASILKKSSNVGISKLALRLGSDKLERTLAKFGFGNDTGIYLIGESMGNLPIRHNWSDFEVATMSFGYGFSATTLQLAKAYAILGSGGIKYPVSILKNSNPVTGERVISKKLAYKLVEMLEGVTQKGGTATKAHIDGYRVAGKTGTSRKADSGGYGDDYVAIFAGLAPVSNPRFAMVVMINDPAGDHYYAGDVAAPVFSTVMKSALLLSHISPDAVDLNYTLLESL